MIIVTGGAGFIGSNIVHYLNALGQRDILVVDDLTDGKKFENLLGADFVDYIDYEDFLQKIIRREKLANQIDVIFHQGACAVTTEWNGRYMMKNNYDYSKVLLQYCQEAKVPMIYASSAAIYGDGKAGFTENTDCEKPLNVYGYSKYLFDQYVRQILPHASAAITGLRYFNVYGPREQHKGSMASVAFHLNQQLLQTGVVKLFEGCDGYGNGEQRRDFIYVEDVAHVNVWCWQNKVSGIYNLGTGQSEPFNAVANAVLNWHGRGQLEYIAFPPHLQGHYQSFTEANMSALRQGGYQAPFRDVAAGVAAYLDWLNKEIIAKMQHNNSK